MNSIRIEELPRPLGGMKAYSLLVPFSKGSWGSEVYNWILGLPVSGRINLVVHYALCLVDFVQFHIMRSLSLSLSI